MRDLTAEELAKCPDGCNHYHIIDDKVYFTNVLGVGIYDIDGNKVDDSLLDGVFMKSRFIEKPFDITQHEWSDVIAEIEPESGHTLVIKSHGSWLSFDKNDVIAMARDRGVTTEDLK